MCATLNLTMRSVVQLDGNVYSGNFYIQLLGNVLSAFKASVLYLRYLFLYSYIRILIICNSFIAPRLGAIKYCVSDTVYQKQSDCFIESSVTAEDRSFQHCISQVYLNVRNL